MGVMGKQLPFNMSVEVRKNRTIALTNAVALFNNVPLKACGGAQRNSPMGACAYRSMVSTSLQLVRTSLGVRREFLDILTPQGC
jgi:hypothetical protein